MAKLLQFDDKKKLIITLAVIILVILFANMVLTAHHILDYDVRTKDMDKIHVRIDEEINEVHSRIDGLYQEIKLIEREI